MLVQVNENMLYKVKSNNNNRLSEMGFIKGTIFRIVKKAFGMVQLRFNSSDVIVREEMMKEIEYE